MVAVPFFFFLLTELTVILFDGAAASWQGLVGPGIRVGFGKPPSTFERPIVFASWLPQKRYCELTATPQGPPLVVPVGTKLFCVVPPPTGTRPTAPTGPRLQ